MDLKKLLNLTGKVILITGGAGHLGTGMCEALAEFGATVYIGDVNMENAEKLADRLTNTYKNSNFPLNIDISDNSDISTKIKQIVDRHGKIDVLINNAYYGSGGDILSMEEEGWLKGIDGSINSVFRCSKIALEYMIKQKAGIIINTASMYGMVAPNVEIYKNNNYYNPGNYGAGKAAVIQFTKYVAAVYGKDGIQCNSIAPGPFPSPPVQENTEFVEDLKKKNPLNKIGKPDDLKGIMVLLASDASKFINGANFVVDGGWTIW